MKLIYPYYKLFKANKSKLIGLCGAFVRVQKKYDDEKTIAITWDNGLIVGDKKEIYSNNSCFRIKCDEVFFEERSHLVFYGTLLNKKLILWDAWDKYNTRFIDTTDIITKYKAHEYYSGKFDLDILEKYNKDYVYRFRYPLLTYYV